MSEEELQVLITLDDPGDAREEDTFNHLEVNNLVYWFAQRFPSWRRLDQRPEGVSDSDAYKVTFGQGDWTCTLLRLNGAMKGMAIEVCTVAHWKNGQIVEQKMFYDLVGMQKQIGGGPQ